MDNRIQFPNQMIPPVSAGKTGAVGKASSDKSGAFKQILEQQVGRELKFSQHAKQRLQTRNIQLGEAEMSQIQQAVQRAREKGARESLVLMGDLALVVSVKNSTVITAVDGDNLRENVFTNIDSAVII